MDERRVTAGLGGPVGVALPGALPLGGATVI